MRLSISRAELAAFLIAAKQRTFASGEDAKRLRDGGRLFAHREGDWSYRDQYYGSRFDSGLEVVVFATVPVWAMVYRGGMLAKYDPDAAAAFAVLKDALRRPPADLPVRGPAHLVAGIWEYACRVRGSLFEFSGEEIMRRGGRRAYYRAFTGGTLRHRSHDIEFIA
ncbi:MAG: DUF5680 domain-containing protein [Acidobacteriota bacterium]